MKTVPRVSVIIPNYNHGHYLRRRVGSVLEQTYRDIEVLFLDDASTDNSREIFREFEDDPRARPCHNRVNSGSVFSQWNRGVRMSRGEYVWIAEADERFLETLVGLAYCHSLVIDANSRVLRTFEYGLLEHVKDRWEHDFVRPRRDEVGELMILQNTIPNASAVVFRKSVYLRAGEADESYRVAGDWLQWIKMLLISDVAFVSQALNYFREDESTNRRKAMSSGRVVREAVRKHQICLRTPGHAAGRQRARPGVLPEPLAGADIIRIDPRLGPREHPAPPRCFRHPPEIPAAFRLKSAAGHRHAHALPPPDGPPDEPMRCGDQAERPGGRRAIPVQDSDRNAAGGQNLAD